MSPAMPASVGVIAEKLVALQQRWLVLDHYALQLSSLLYIVPLLVDYQDHETPSDVDHILC